MAMKRPWQTNRNPTGATPTSPLFFYGDKMKSQQRFKSDLFLLAVLVPFLLLSACAPTPSPTPFLPPRASTPTQALAQGSTPVIPTSTPRTEPTPSPTATPPCTDGLAFVEDITIPDGTIVSPGATVDKQWLVQNNGSCNWDSRYRLKFSGGSEMGATTEQALFPARAGSQATIRISFTAPSETGTYSTAWQAIDPNGEPFGDAVFMEIEVSN